ncbi:hypothetical protein [Flavobacterium psychrophilum]|uniref:hypothetical protein n=1 Tax=Flavobacterium psychrophilum TaxID=96345 RepID=UPI000B7C32C9|nr:hypothetical protein [Flavobacterium psychrophilum]SNA68984.1 exported hypothetical protein [Flavobacterium psychrophilum]SNB01127.1 exported hypothetical protein [Flavobacterium psychrophilum]
MKKYIFIILMSVVSNFGLAQSKTTTQSNTKSSESYNYTSTFDKSKTIEIFNYLKTEIGMNYTNSKGKFVWQKISDLETKNDITYIKLEKDKIEINYQNNNNLLNQTIIDKLKKISNTIKDMIN